MDRLVEHKLIFGRLMEVSEPHLLERYNKALEAFGLPKTKLKKFQIDMTGFSPEVAEEMKDPQYLDPLGINRRFIILSPEQASLPVVHTSFSNTQGLMHKFYERNARALYALTIKDVVFGEIEDSVYEAKSIDDLLSIEQVQFKVRTADSLLNKTAELKLMIDRLLKEPEAWRDDEMLNKMVDYAKTTGDIRTNKLTPQEVVFRHNTFWAAHFGGVYVFNDENQTTVISDSKAKGFRKSRPWQVSYLDIKNTKQVYRFLAETGRIDPPRGAWIEGSGLLDRRFEMTAAWLALNFDEKLKIGKFSTQWARSWVRNNKKLAKFEGIIPLLDRVKAEVSNWSNIDMDDIDNDHKFLISRANPEHDDHYLVNRLISEFLPFDYLTLFVFNKPKFYEQYKKWPDNYADFVVNQISDVYFTDKKALRETLYR